MVKDAATKQNSRTVFDAPYRLFDHLYIGNAKQAADINQLKELGITHIINCAGGDSRVRTNRKSYGKFIEGYYEIKGRDSRFYNMIKHFDDVYYLIEDARQEEGKVFLHCSQGVNRSGVLAVAYCMVYKKWKLHEALVHCTKARGLILLNEGFQHQLVDFAERRGFLGSTGYVSSQKKYLSSTDIDSIHHEI